MRLGPGARFGPRSGRPARRVLGVLLLFVPFLDRPKSPGARPSRTLTYVTFAVLAFIFIMTYLGYAANPTQ